MTHQHTGSTLFAQCLVKQGVKRIFVVPGDGIIDLIFALAQTEIELITCRHEQNAVFMAMMYGRLTGSPGVVLVTSGPGVTNLTTGLLTATTEGDPVIAIGGNVSRSMRFKQTHQQAENTAILTPATKSSVEILIAENIPEVIDNAFRYCVLPRAGACFISITKDVLFEKTNVVSFDHSPKATVYHDNVVATEERMNTACAMITSAKRPLLLVGEEASRYDVTESITLLLKHHAIACVATYQAAGCIPRDLAHLFVGEVGLFNNQPGDDAFQTSDLIIAIGYNPIEYDPEVWHTDASKKIIHIAYTPCDIRAKYRPTLECEGNIGANLNHLAAMLPAKPHLSNQPYIDDLRNKNEHELKAHQAGTGKRIHPLSFIKALRANITDDTVVISDIGAHYLWLARYLRVYKPRRLLFSNGQQTMGVALPWAIGTHFATEKETNIDRVISISGDGGFLFSAMELETAVRLSIPFVHFVWCDGTYNMVKEQQLKKFQESSCITLGPIDIVTFAKSFGAHGFLLDHIDKLGDILTKALTINGPVLVEVPIDYADNAALFKDIDDKHH